MMLQSLECRYLTYTDRDALIKDMDKNGDGKVSTEEIALFREQHGDNIDAIRIGDRTYNAVFGEDGQSVQGTDADEIIFATNANSADGGEGDDMIFAGDCEHADGGAGNDFTYGYNTKCVAGGDGNDELISIHDRNSKYLDNSVVLGGRGNDSAITSNVNKVFSDIEDHEQRDFDLNADLKSGFKSSLTKSEQPNLIDIIASLLS